MWLLGQPTGEHASSGAGPDHDDIEMVRFHRHSPVVPRIVATGSGGSNRELPCTSDVICDITRNLRRYGAASSLVGDLPLKRRPPIARPRTRVTIMTALNT